MSEGGGWMREGGGWVDEGEREASASGKGTMCSKKGSVIDPIDLCGKLAMLDLHQGKNRVLQAQFSTVRGCD